MSATATAITLALPKEYGYVLATGVASYVLLMGLGISVGGQRKRAQVPYPYLYADTAEAKEDKKKYIFNCYQRAHQNTLEFYPIFISSLLISGLKHPYIATGAGVAWILGRIVYARGYQTGDPSKRNRGAFHFLALTTLMGAAASTAYQLITL
ncbi:uncharacterized protein VTP21DRAFT_4706 [Calcarisporiella thermophila]|uniref:uncharacterized protein n=1 Tax=Calcarisporiella thermophila TaxID=911321 RepID=UPI003742E971